jgi:phosphoglycolate phosphatase
MFDLDGTLIDSRADLATAVNLTRADYGLAPLATDTVAGFVGDGIHKLVERAFHDHPVDLREAVRRCARHYHEHMFDHTRLYPGVADGLARLRAAGCRLAVITNKPAAACRAILRHLEIEPLFAVVVGGGDTEHLKPHPEPLLKILDQLRAPPTAAWMIGDHHTDLRAARAAGVRSVFLEYGFGHAGGERATRMFGSFPELVQFFLTPEPANGEG